MSQPENDDPHAPFAVAVAHLDDVDTSAPGEPSDTTAWDAILALQHTGSRAVLDLCAVRRASPNPRERRVAAAVLGQLGVTRQASTVFSEERFQVLHALLLAEVAGPANASVLADACIALGHLHDPRAVPAVAALRGHPDPDVRYAVVYGLLDHDIDEAVSALIALSADDEAQVRDWATFGLGQQIKRDTPSVRAALAARLTDPDRDTREEALCGLVRRGDAAGIEALIAALRADGPSPVLLEAAILAASPTLCPALRAAEVRLPGPDVDRRNDIFRQDMTDALRACGCGAAGPMPQTSVASPTGDGG